MVTTWGGMVGGGGEKGEVGEGDSEEYISSSEINGASQVVQW